MIKLIIFDMDGLMFDTESVTARAFLEISAAKGYKANLYMYKELIGLDARATQARYREFFGQETDAEQMYYEVGNRLEELIRQEGIPVKPGLYTLLDEIERLQLKKVIASGSNRARILENLRHAGLEDRFDAMISSEQVKRGKPQPDVFLECLRQTNTAPEEALVLEDSRFGIMAALAANIPVIVVPDLLPIPPELGAQCLAVKESLGDIRLGDYLS